MSKIEEIYDIQCFRKINEDHLFSCSEEVERWVHQNEAYWIIDLINAYSTSTAILQHSWLTRWEFKVEGLRGWLIADNGCDEVHLRRRLTYVPMEDFSVSFLRRGEFLVMAE